VPHTGPNGTGDFCQTPGRSRCESSGKRSILNTNRGSRRDSLRQDYEVASENNREWERSISFVAGLKLRNFCGENNSFFRFKNYSGSQGILSSRRSTMSSYK